MTWDEIKTTFENEILCPALQGRLRLEYYEQDIDESAIEDFDKHIESLDDSEPVYSYLSFYFDDKLIYEFNSKNYYENQYYKLGLDLRSTIKDILSRDYLSKSASFDAAWDIYFDFIPRLTSQNGMMKAEHAVRCIKNYIIDHEHEDTCLDNKFTFVLYFLSKYMSGEVVLNNEESSKLAFAETWFYPFIQLRIEAEKDFQTQNK